ncbi:MAG: HAMP domain-containing histidine kinase [Proteobacteria bacterium]|nr:HAMP domain-containing histidine kinase [Pseudomonadota bacterium]
MNPISVETALDALAERVSDPVVRIGAGSRVVFANAAFAREFGPAPSDILELAGGDLCRTELAATIAIGGERELPLLDASGRLRLVSVDAMRCGGGQIVVLRPQLPESKRAGDVFIATASHELRTPLNAILGFAQLLERGIGGAVTAKQREYLASIRTGTDLLVGIVEELLEVAQDDSAAERLHEATLDLTALARAQRDLMRADAETRKVELAADLPEAPMLVRADARKLAKAMLDLLSNAIRFSPAGSTVTIGVGRNPAGAIVIWVADQGPGIPPTDERRLGAPSVSLDNAYLRRTPGSGIGLAIVRRYVEQHGGHLDIGTAPGGGASVTMRLPADRLVGAAEARRI